MSAPLPAAVATTVAAPVPAAPVSGWLDRSATPDERARRLVAAMTENEKLALVTGYFGVQQSWNEYRFPEARPQSAGVVLGVPRLGFPPEWQSDAGSGVATQGEAPPELERTLLPSGILTASTWDPELAERGGAMIGSEARASGFNVMLAGGVNLMREPGNGRNFEYGGEDPLLAGTMVGALVRGIQSNHIVATVKHFALNDQETARRSVNVLIDESAARISDLLAFQIAIERGDPGSVMCSYNLVNGVHACQDDWLLNRVLKRDWDFRGYVMSDWGAQHDSVADANHGLDQETGVFRRGEYQFLDKLAGAVARGAVSPARLDDMALRVSRSLIAKGAVDDPVTPGPIDFAAHAAVSEADAEGGIVLLKNAGTLPLDARVKRIAVIGGHADVGVLTGGGSAQVYSPGGNAVRGLGPPHWPGPHVYARSSPLEALKRELPNTAFDFNDGADRAAAAKAAAGADLAIVFATQWTAESLDFPLALPNDQDALIDAVARANRRTIVVLETGGPVLMPWLARVNAVVEAWYPGTRGGPAIARILSGAVNPSGHLPVSFPRTADQLPRAKTEGVGATPDIVFDVHYDEGAAVGYRWYDARHAEPLFPFGHGLAYTTFTRQGLVARLEDGELRVRFRVKNSGKRPGQDVAQIYVGPLGGGWESPKHLAGFAKSELAPGATRDVIVTLDPRLFALWDAARSDFHVAAGRYRVTLASSARDPGQSVTLALEERRLPAGAGSKGD
ncbi:MAG TPA: glycoside hydrolase family 3 C-terminal domain-containing protein [Polyangiaceae bacterium]|nr:glycoside hydrolase family 3 C-terminal domain-containing protein [Polyangiaceae bacterium]